MRIADYSFDSSTLKTAVSNVMASDVLNGFQVIVRREEAMDVMVFRVASRPKDPDRLARENWAEELKNRDFNPLSVDWISAKGLMISRRTGKLWEIVDLRVE